MILKFKTPSTPNFIISESVGPVPISEFSDDELKEIALKWTMELLKKANHSRNKKYKNLN